jgi:hypothetical protein
MINNDNNANFKDTPLLDLNAFIKIKSILEYFFRIFLIPITLIDWGIDSA